MAVVDTPSSVFVTGLRDPQINSLRTRMYRRDVQISATKVTRREQRGHVITARTVRPEERG